MDSITQDLVIELKFKIIKVDDGAAIGFAVVSNEHHQDAEQSLYDTPHGYVLFNSGWAYVDGKPEKQVDLFADADDVVSLILDLARRQLRAQVNDGKEEVVVQDVKNGVNIKYKFGFTFYAKHSSVEILSYSQSVLDDKH